MVIVRANMKRYRILAVSVFAALLVVGLLCLSDWWFPNSPPVWYRRILMTIAWPIALVGKDSFILPLLAVTGLFWGILAELLLLSRRRKKTNEP